MSPELADAAARARAVADLDTSLLVEAPAGSGKTTLLVERVLAWVRHGRARLPEIVAITFTEKAAADLRLRVREALERARRLAGESEGAVLDQALAELELAPIRTIHGFCGDLIRERPVEAGVDPGFAVADPLETALVLEEVWDEWLEGAAPDAPPALQEAIALGLPLETLRALGYALVRERDLLDGLPAPVSEDATALNRAARERLTALAATVPGGPRAVSDTLARQVEELADWVRQTDALPEGEQVTALLTELRIPVVTRLGSQAVWGREPLWRARGTLQELAAEIARARGRRLHDVAARLARWLTGFVEAYRARMRRLGLLDFHDLLTVTRDLLRERPDVRREFQRRFRTVLVDEFQDTDPLQLEIAFFLGEAPTGEPAPRWDAVRLGPGRLFLVGDPKQSVYRFRRADIETYERARALVAAQGEVLTLATNFRAGRRLLDAVNHTFAVQMQPPDDGRYQPAYAPVVPPPGTDEGDPPLLLEWADGVAPGRIPERRVREAEALATLVADVMRTGRFTVRERDTGARRAASYGDVVCLFRALTNVAVYEDAFRAAGVPYRTVGSRHYYTRSEVGWALAALAAIDDPHDPIALVAALRSPFFGVPDGALLAHAAGGGRFSYLAPLPLDAPPPLAHAWRTLGDLHEARVHESPVAVVEALYARTEVLATYALDPHGDQRVANLLRILDTARALESAGRRTFRALVRWLQGQDAAGYEEGESPIAEEGDQVVRLMTIHAAKGLEFPALILPDLEWDRGPGTPLLVADRRPEAPGLAVSLGKVGEWKLETENFEGLLDREARRAQAELLRLFYVAMTRARDQLVLPLLVAGEPRGFMAFCAPLLDDGFGGVRRLVIDLRPPERPAPPPEEAPVLVPRETWAAAKVAALARGTGGEPARPDPRRGATTRLWPLARAALALIDLRQPDAAAAVTAAAERLGARPARVRAAQRLVGRVLATPPYRRASLAARVLTQVPVVAPLDGEPTEGTVDLLFETDSGWVAVAIEGAPADEGARARLTACGAALGAAGHRLAEAWLLVASKDAVELAEVPLRTQPSRTAPQRSARLR